LVYKHVVSYERWRKKDTGCRIQDQDNLISKIYCLSNDWMKEWLNDWI
jgi:hypothetical protein